MSQPATFQGKEQASYMMIVRKFNKCKAQVDNYTGSTSPELWKFFVMTSYNEKKNTTEDTESCMIKHNHMTHELYKLVLPAPWWPFLKIQIHMYECM